MKSAIELVGFGFLLPAVVAMAFFFLARKALPFEIAQRYAIPLAMIAGFASGYFLLPWTKAVPERHWQWLPYLGVMTAVIGAISVAPGIRRAERWMLYIFVALVAAWFLVPTWSTLRPGRPILIGVLVAYFVALMALLDLLPDRLLETRFLGLLTIVLLLTGVGVAMSVSVTYGQLAAMTAATSAGCWLAARVLKGNFSSRAVVPLYATLAGGVAFIATIEPEPPVFAMLLFAVAPLSVWCFVAGPLSRLTPRMQAFAQSLAVALPCIAVLAYLAAI